MFVACSTVCFTKYPLERALRTIAEMEFNKVEVCIDERGPHLKPSEVVADVVGAGQRIRIGPSLTPAAFTLELDDADPKQHPQQVRAACHLARLSHVSLLTISAAPATTDINTEVERLKGLVHLCAHEGTVLCVVSRIGTLTETPEVAIELCKRVPGLGLTLDPSHYHVGPNAGRSYDDVFPYVKHVHLRDTGSSEDELQVRVGQGEIEYGRIVTQLARQHYNRLLTVEIYDVADAPWLMEQEVRKLKYLLESLV